MVSSCVPLSMLVAVCKHRRVVEWTYEDGAALPAGDVCPQCDEDADWHMTRLQQ